MFWIANFLKHLGKNSAEIAATEARVVEELEAFRTEKFMYFLFINALWMIVTSIILLYTDSLISIDIEIPRGEDTSTLSTLMIDGTMQNCRPPTIWTCPLMSPTVCRHLRKSVHHLFRN